MGDQYKDHQEIIRYADHTENALKPLLSLDPILGKVSAGQADLARSIRENLAVVDSKASGHKSSANKRRQLHQTTKERLDRLHLHLVAAQADGHVVDLQQFFSGGAKVSAKQSIADRQAALEKARQAWTDHKAVPGADTWPDELAQLAADYAAGTGAFGTGTQDKLNAERALKSLKTEWKRHYRATKPIVEGVQLLAGREAEYKGCFLDLQLG